MSRVFLHNKYNKYSLIKILLILLSIFFLYGFYKNGINLYLKGLVSLFSLFIPLIFMVISLFTSLIFFFLDKEYFEYRLLLNVCLALVVPINSDIIVFAILIILCNILFKFIKINYLPIFMIITGIYLFITKNFTFQNIFEASTLTHYSFVDYLFGKGLGGCGCTLLIVDILALIILSYVLSYKKHIPIYGFITYYILLIVSAFVCQKMDLDLFFNANLLFSFIFICPISLFSPYSKGGDVLYGVLLGILSFGISFVNLDFGIYIVIFLMNLISPYLDKFIVKQTNRNLIDAL